MPSPFLLNFTNRLKGLPATGGVDFGSLRRLEPIGPGLEGDRGMTIDKYYIEQFLKGHKRDIRGRVLEVQDNEYAKKFGRDVQQVDVVNRKPGPRATFVSDMARGHDIPTDTFDCLLLIQNVQCTYDVRAVVRTAYRILKPGGVLLCTANDIAAQGRAQDGEGGDYWRFTSLSLVRLLQEYFPHETVTVEAYGNVLTAAASLYGLGAGELTLQELDHRDANYEVIVGGRATKPIRGSS
jgi:SAM-dependent methyltransferase